MSIDRIALEDDSIILLEDGSALLMETSDGVTINYFTEGMTLASTLDNDEIRSAKGLTY